MPDTPFFQSETFAWVILPILIFFARILDVSIGTIRLIFLARGAKLITPVLGFFEVLIWLLAVGQIITHMNNFLCYIAYGCGFATGTFVGMWIEERLSIGNAIVRVITRRDASALIESLASANYGVTSLDAQGATGPAKIIFTIVRRQDLGHVTGLIQGFDPEAFYTVEDVRAVKEGVFPSRPAGGMLACLNVLRLGRKGK